MKDAWLMKEKEGSKESSLETIRIVNVIHNVVIHLLMQMRLHLWADITYMLDEVLEFANVWWLMTKISSFWSPLVLISWEYISTYLDLIRINCMYLPANLRHIYYIYSKRISWTLSLQPCESIKRETPSPCYVPSLLPLSL